MIPANRESAAARQKVAENMAKLTPRELQIMDEILCGTPLKQIALRTGRKYNTLRNQRRKVLTKMGVESAVELLRLFVAAWVGRALPAAEGMVMGEW